MHRQSHICEWECITISSFSSLSFFLCLSPCWQSLIAIDKLMKSNTGKTTAALHPACTCHSVYPRVCIPVSARAWLSCVLRHASLSKTMMIQYESPYLQVQVCELVMNINYDYKHKKTRRGSCFVLRDHICIPLHQKCLTIWGVNGSVGTFH